LFSFWKDLLISALGWRVFFFFFFFIKFLQKRKGTFIAQQKKLGGGFHTRPLSAKSHTTRSLPSTMQPHNHFLSCSGHDQRRGSKTPSMLWEWGPGWTLEWKDMQQKMSGEEIIQRRRRKSILGEGFAEGISFLRRTTPMHAPESAFLT
jgi:hypothetical protein